MIALAPSHKAQLENYTSWLEKRGIPYRILQPKERLDGFSMLLLCGGPDVGTAGERDEQESRWFKEAYGKIPVLGICRGLQLSNVMLGGTLHADLDTEKVKHTANKTEIAGEPHSLLESSWHEIDFKEGKKIRVNSRHHQGIDQLAPGLTAIAYCSEDGLIEMAKGEKALFVQWHPERPDVWGTEAEEIVYHWVKEHFIETSPATSEIDPIEKIFSYMRSKSFTVVSNERIRKSIDSTYTDGFLRKLVLENATRIKKVKDRQGRLAVKMIK
jgi:GMP synthase-like glutamine amidotransferase